MNKQIKALKMAIEALEDFSAQYANLEPIINSCKEALEQQAQEPVAWMYVDGAVSYRKDFLHTDPLYTRPAQPAESGLRSPLSDDEIRQIIAKEGIPVRTGNTAVRFARAIEQAHKIGERNGQTHNSSNEWNISGTRD